MRSRENITRFSYQRSLTWRRERERERETERATSQHSTCAAASLKAATMAYSCSPFLLMIVLLAVPIYSAPPPGTSPAVLQAANANTKFSLDLLKSLNQEKKGQNIFYSPYSISAALAMTSLGAAGNTLAEIDRTFHFDLINQNDPMAIHRAYQTLIEMYNAANANYSLSTANRLFGDNDFTVLQTFQDNARKYYHAELQQLAFKSGKAEGVINEWVEKQTNNKIKDLIAKGSLEDAVLVLVNAIYFKGTWQTKFDAKNTKKEPFHLSNTQKKDVDMMKLTAEFKYYYDSNLRVKVLEMPYTGGDLSMVVVLPDGNEGLDSVINQLTDDKLTQLMGKMVKEKVDVSFPKFKLETEYALKPTLDQLGIHDLFTESAKLSALSQAEVKVSKIIHKAFIEIDEEGTEAAAATSIEIVPMSLQIPPPPPTPTFIADQPFLFSIVHRESNLILFTGLLVNL